MVLFVKRGDKIIPVVRWQQTWPPTSFFHSPIEIRQQILLQIYDPSTSPLSTYRIRRALSAIIYAPAPPYWRWHLERAYYLKTRFDNKIYQYYLDELLEVGRICRAMRDLHVQLGLDLVWVAEQWRRVLWGIYERRVNHVAVKAAFWPRDPFEGCRLEQAPCLPWDLVW